MGLDDAGMAALTPGGGGGGTLRHQIHEARRVRGLGRASPAVTRSRAAHVHVAARMCPQAWLLRESVVRGADARTRICFHDVVTAPTAVTVEGENHDCNEDDTAGGDGVGGDRVTTGAATRVESQCSEDQRDNHRGRPGEANADAARRTGNEDTFNVSQDVQRFNELMVGQKVNLTYYESVVYQLVKAGEKGSGTSFDATVNRGAGALPAATIATQEKMTVTVKSIDAAVPSVTVAADDGRVVTRKIENRRISRTSSRATKSTSPSRGRWSRASRLRTDGLHCGRGRPATRDAYARIYWSAAILLSVGRPGSRNARAWGLATTGVASGKTQLPLRISARGL